MQQQRGRQPASRSPFFVPAQNDAGEEDSEEYYDADPYEQAYAQEIQRRRQLLEAQREAEQQKRLQRQRELLERERILRDLEEQKRAAAQQAEIKRLREHALKQKQYQDYLRSLEAQRAPLDGADHDADEMDQSEPADDQPQGFYHPFYGFIPANSAALPSRGGGSRAGLRRSRSLSPPKSHQMRGVATPFGIVYPADQTPSAGPESVPVNINVRKHPVASPQVPVKQLPRPEPDEATRERAAIKIQSAVRAFLVRSQRIIPKLKEIASVRSKVQLSTTVHSEIIDSWRSLGDAISAFRSGAERAPIVLPEQKDRSRLLTYEEELLRHLISLDNVTAGRSDLVREQRKNLVRHIQQYLSDIDSAKGVLKQLPAFESELATASLVASIEPSSDSQAMDVDVTPVESHQDDMEAESTSVETPDPAPAPLSSDNEVSVSNSSDSIAHKLSEEDLQLLLRTLAANKINLDDLRPSATPKQFSLTTLAL
jgi:hypothetical protein